MQLDQESFAKFFSENRRPPSLRGKVNRLEDLPRYFERLRGFGQAFRLAFGPPESSEFPALPPIPSLPRRPRWPSGPKDSANWSTS